MAVENPWSSNDLLLGVKLGDPRSGVVIARRCGLLEPQVCTHCAVVSSMNTPVEAVLHCVLDRLVTIHQC